MLHKKPAAQDLAWDYSDPTTGVSLPAHFFYDRQVFEDEKQAIFFKCWHVVGHVNEFREPGNFICQDIFEQSVLVVAGRDGEIRAFHNACQHRGNRLVNERRGKLPSVLRCQYHSWCYGLDGALRSAPRTECLKNFDKALYGLKPVRLEIFASFVYVTLDDKATSLAESLPGAEAEMRRFLPDLDNVKLVEEVDVIVDANWKVIQENSIEGYHFDLSGPVHKHLASLIDFNQYRLTPRERWWTYMAPPNPNAKEAYGLPIAGATWQTDWFFNIGLWPNTTFYCFPFTDMVSTFIMIPLEPEKSLLRFGYYAPENRPTPELTKSAIKWMNQELGPEDIMLNVTNQKGLHSLGFQHGRYLIDPEHPNQSEHLVHHFHKLCYQAIRE
ncbi:choline monooxygenase [Dongia mobilis]|uniref:Choline monooxygenase n=1 Tax=Dongia mobilis TaxID=578943 RepID=A0A4R6WQE2_9PROT|nr:aromatic ring-hydroxylating dioxygenase subunit alpha [Dongia mobilis]TDQ83355.1 choline monooxygenase [Dongia mobilis]